MRWRSSFALCFVTGVAALASATPAGAMGLVNTCVVQQPKDVDPYLAPWASVRPDAEGMRLDSMSYALRGASEATLGSQDGGVWLNLWEHKFFLALAPGSISVAQAQQTMNMLLDRDFSASDAAFAKPRVEVISVPYSQAKLSADRSTIFARIERVTASRPGFGGGVAYPPAVAFPQIQVMVNNTATDQDCAAALAVVQSYPGEAILQRENIGLPIPDIGRAAPPPLPAPPPARASPKHPVKAKHTRHRHHASQRARKHHKHPH